MTQFPKIHPVPSRFIGISRRRTPRHRGAPRAAAWRARTELRLLRGRRGLFAGAVAPAVSHRHQRQQKQGGGFQLASINTTGSALATAPPQVKEAVARANESVGKANANQDDAVRLFANSLGGGNRGADAIRGLGGRVLQDSELTPNQKANRDQSATNAQNAERQFIQAANDSGNNVRLATLEVRALLGEDLAIRKLKFLDVVLDELGDGHEDATAEADASFALLTLELERLLGKLAEWFGLPRPADA